MVQGYCLKEKKPRDIKDPKYEINAKGRPVVRGKCANCGTTIYKILAASEVPADLKAKQAKKGSYRKSTRGSKRKSRKSRTGSAKSKRSRKSSRRSKRSRKH